MRSARTGIRSYAIGPSTGSVERRDPSQRVKRNLHSQTAAAFGALAVASVAAGTAIYLSSSDDEPSAAINPDDRITAGASSGEKAGYPAPSISLLNPITPPDDNASKVVDARPAAFPEAEETRPTIRTRQQPSPQLLPGADAIATRLPSATLLSPVVKEEGDGSDLQAPVAQQPFVESPLADTGDPSPSLDVLRTDEATSAQALAGKMASPGEGDHSVPSAAAGATTPSPASDRFLPILEGIVTSGSGLELAAASDEALNTPTIGPGKAEPDRGVAASPAEDVKGVRVSAGYHEAAVATEMVPASSGSDVIERSAQSPLRADDGSNNAGRQAPLVADVSPPLTIPWDKSAVEGPSETLGASNVSAGAELELRYETAILALGDVSGRASTGVPGDEAQNVNGVRSSPVLPADERPLAGAPSLRGAAMSEPAARAEAKSPADSHLVASGVIREDDRVAFAESGRRPPRSSLVGAVQMTTVSVASHAQNDGPAYSRDAADPLDAIALLDSGDGTVQLRLADLITLLENRMERPLFVWLKSAESASKYVTFDTLRAAGISVDHDPIRNHVTLSVPETSDR